MMKIESILKQNPAVDDFRIVSKATKSYELFFVHRKLETVRSTDTVDTDVTVYVRHDGKIGDSNFSVYPSMSEADVAAKVEAAVARAKLVSNENYDLPEGGVGNVEVASNFAEFSMQELASKIADAVFAADCYAEGSINATEIFVYHDEVHVQNSRGIDKTQSKYHAMIEAIPTWNAGEESVELYEDFNFMEFDAAEITAEIDGKMREVRDRQLAVKPQTPMECNVILKPHEIMELLGSYAYQLHFQSVYSKSNLYKIGDDLQKNGKGDKLTMTMLKGVKGSVQTAAFDADGVDLQNKTVVRDGVVEGFFGGNRYAQYLKQEATGELRCLQVACGTLTEAEINAAPYVECVSLSGLQVDLYNDYVGGEIRLAYYFDGEKTVPITGISMSAKLSDVLAELRLSEHSITHGSYEGPSQLLLRDVHIL